MIRIFSTRASLRLLAPFFALTALLTLSVDAQIRVTPLPTAPAPTPAPSTIPTEPAGAGGLTTLERQVNLNESAYSAIVRVENEAWIPNYQTPWNAGGSGGGSGTGFLVGPNMFLTNAHVVSNSRLLFVKKVDDPKPYEAEIVHIAHDCDLALLRLKDSSAFEDVKPLQIGNVPPLNSTVIAVGYPIGGQRISVTRGVVSRIDFRAYAHSDVDWHLAVQVDAAINPGNSGGPVIQNGKVVGVAFQGYSGNVAQNTGYMIPSPVINRFLLDIKDGEYDYYPDLAVSHFNILNPAQRKAMKLPDDGIGVMVASADSAGSGGGLLETGDIVIAIDGHPVGSDGYISLNGARVNMNEIVERKYVGDNVKLTLVRDHKPMEIDVELKRFLPYLIQANTYDNDPQFVVFSGLVFQPVDRNLMAAHGITNLQVRYLYTYFSKEEIYEEKPQIIVITKILPDEVNTHLGPYLHKVVEEVNGKKIRTIKDLHQALFVDEVEGEFHVIKLMSEGRPIVIEKSRVEAAQARIKATYGVTREQLLGDPIMGPDAG
ncbi:MAG: S1-C subfamily serine protease [Verrucomicrobiales bacterium]|jgi:S1-C subfamily serine protease